MLTSILTALYVTSVIDIILFISVSALNGYLIGYPTPRRFMRGLVLLSTFILSVYLLSLLIDYPALTSGTIRALTTFQIFMILSSRNSSPDTDSKDGDSESPANAELIKSLKSSPQKLHLFLGTAGTTTGAILLAISVFTPTNTIPYLQGFTKIVFGGGLMFLFFAVSYPKAAFQVLMAKSSKQSD